jgi:hypothetical protein
MDDLVCLFDMMTMQTKYKTIEVMGENGYHDTFDFTEPYTTHEYVSFLQRIEYEQKHTILKIVYTI